jgi:hypothetical protein
MDLKGAGYEVMDYICLAQDRIQWRDFVCTVMNFYLHKRPRNFFFTNSATVRFLIRKV